MQGITLIHSKQVSLFEQCQMAVGVIVGNLLNLLFIALSTSRLGVTEHEIINL